MYLKIENSKMNSSCDVFYHKINKKDKTWKSILSAFEDELEAHFVENGRVMGINFTVEIVNRPPEDTEFDD